MAALDDIRQRAEAAKRSHSGLSNSLPVPDETDRARLLGAVEAVLALHAGCFGGKGCETTRAVHDALERR